MAILTVHKVMMRNFVISRAISENLFVTKRVLLSFIARIFDPLGFAAPFILQANVFFNSYGNLDSSGLRKCHQSMYTGFADEFLSYNCCVNGTFPEMTQVSVGVTSVNWSFMDLAVPRPRLMGPVFT